MWALPPLEKAARLTLRTRHYGECTDAAEKHRQTPSVGNERGRLRSSSCLVKHSPSSGSGSCCWLQDSASQRRKTAALKSPLCPVQLLHTWIPPLRQAQPAVTAAVPAPAPVHWGDLPAFTGQGRLHRNQPSKQHLSVVSRQPAWHFTTGLSPLSTA